MISETSAKFESASDLCAPEFWFAYTYIVVVALLVFPKRFHLAPAWLS